VPPNLPKIVREAVCATRCQRTAEDVVASL
jgi:hypothetical protein